MQILSEEMVDGVIERTLWTIDSIGKKYKLGLLTETDCFHLMLSEFQDGFLFFLSGKNLKIRIDEDNFEQFSREFFSYPDLENMHSPDHRPWLFVRDTGDEASKEDQKLVFHLMKEYCLCPEYFEPVPSSIANPKRSFVHGWHGSTAYSIPYRCIDDGGLLEDEDPVGKTFRLVNDLGLETVIKIKEDRRQGDRTGLDFDEKILRTGGGIAALLAQFLGEGYIEGYTSKERKGTPDIIIRLDHNGDIFCLAYYSVADDEVAFETFPLWQEYFRRTNDKIMRDKMILSSLFVKYINQIDTDGDEV